MSRGCSKFYICALVVLIDLTVLTRYREHGCRLAGKPGVDQLWANVRCVSGGGVFSGPVQPNHLSPAALPQWYQVPSSRGHIQVWPFGDVVPKAAWCR